MALTEFQRAYQKAITGREPEPMPLVEPDHELEPLTAEQVNARIRETEDKNFLIYEPTNNQRRVLTAPRVYGGAHSS